MARSHHLDRRAGLLAFEPRIVVDADLDDAAALDVRLRVDFGVDQRAGAGKLHATQHVGLEDLEAAVDVAQVHLEEQLDHLVEARADQKR